MNTETPTPANEAAGTIAMMEALYTGRAVKALDARLKDVRDTRRRLMLKGIDIRESEEYLRELTILKSAQSLCRNIFNNPNFYEFEI